MGKKKNIDYDSWSKDELIKEIRRIKETTYGLVWHRDLPADKIDVLINPDARTPKEMFANEIAGKPFPALKQVKSKKIAAGQKDQTHLMIEGDNYHALAVLNFTHQGAVDVIYIDPPYNTGKNDFMYADKFKSGYVEKEDPFRHSKWLSFMEKRVNLAHNLLSPTGVLIVHIDENEESALYFFLAEIFGEHNNLGKIIWNKKNPKGDSKGVSIMHESILCFAKDREKFLKLENPLRQKKPNAEIILRKAAGLFKKIGKTVIPDEVREVIKPYDYSKEQLDDFKITYDLNIVNKEFQNWLNRRNFSGGEGAYRFIDDKGNVYSSVSMAWPNKKEAPEQYFIPLIHPVTGKKCPVPERGWRHPPDTMKRLLSMGQIIFGENESTQPRRKYLLKDNLLQNTTSIFADGSSDDELLKALEVEFEYPKPVAVSKYILTVIHPNPKVILDFMAGSGTTGHAVLSLNQEDGEGRQFILCTNNENSIATEVCYPRIKKVMNGYKTPDGKKVAGLGGNLKYFTAYDFVESEPTDINKRKLVLKSTEMLSIKEGVYDLVKDAGEFKILKNAQEKYLGIIFYEEAINEFKKEVRRLKKKIVTYVFSLEDDPHSKKFSDVQDKVVLEPIPEVILRVYREIFR